MQQSDPQHEWKPKSCSMTSTTACSKTVNHRKLISFYDFHGWTKGFLEPTSRWNTTRPQYNHPNQIPGAWTFPVHGQNPLINWSAWNHDSSKPANIEPLPTTQCGFGYHFKWLVKNNKTCNPNKGKGQVLLLLMAHGTSIRPSRGYWRFHLPKMVRFSESIRTASWPTAFPNKQSGQWFPLTSRCFPCYQLQGEVPPQPTSHHILTSWDLYLKLGGGTS